MLWKDRRGYSMTFWAVFIGLVMVPALALAIELGRYFYAISEVVKAADAAAVAASAEIDQKVFQDIGSLIPTSKTWGNAQSYVTSNTTGLSAKVLTLSEKVTLSTRLQNRTCGFSHIRLLSK